VPLALAWINVLIHKTLKLRIQCPDLVVNFKAHKKFLLLQEWFICGYLTGYVEPA
jgi:hypothetical protein